MNSDNDNYYSKDWIREEEIPKVFKTYISEEYFKNCIVCDKYLLDDTTDYVIEKAYRDEMVEFEYAMCLNCAENMKSNLSEKSMKAINDYFEANMEMNSRFNLISNPATSVDAFISNCAVNGKSLNELKEYQIMAHCRGKKIIVSVLPYMISVDVIEKIQDILSPQTKDELDRFMDNHFGLPPELMEVIRDKKLILI